MYKLIALDLDGTLLKNDKTISKRNIENIMKAKEKGVKVVIATGRPIKGVRNIINQLGLDTKDDYCVTCNGSLVQNNHSREVLCKTSLKGSDYKYLYNLSLQLGVNMHGVMEDKVITPKLSKYTNLESELNGIEIKEVESDTLSEELDVIKIMYVDDPHILEPVIEEVIPKLSHKYSMVQSEPFFFEFLKLGTNKWTGIEALANKLGIKQEEIICVGDAGNDSHMIKNAGLGVAMKNGFQEIKNIANYITNNTNEEDGVSEVIEKFIL